MDDSNKRQGTFEKVRRKLAGTHGQEYWRSLDEVAETEEFQQWVDDEFPNRSTLLQIDRRSLLKFMGASMMLAGLGGCRSLFLPTEKVFPYVNMPEEMVPGNPLYFATSMPTHGSAIGLVVESHEGRPTKIEGNPSHPGSLGSTDAFAQAALLDLYDPDRAVEVTNEGMGATWEIFLKAARSALDAQRQAMGAGIRVLAEPVSSPTRARLLAEFQTAYPAAKVHTYSPSDTGSALSGSQLAFGKPLSPVYHIANANVVVSLDGDFLHGMDGSVRMARDFMSKRHVSGADASGMNRLYAAESTPTLTGANADHRLAVRPGEIELLARALAAAVGVPGVAVGELKGLYAKWSEVAAKDLAANSGKGLVLAGPAAPPSVHALAYAINSVLGNVGSTIGFVDSPFAVSPSGATGLSDLVSELDAGSVDFLLVLGGNPAFDAPGDIPLESAIGKAKFSIHHTSSANETSKQCLWTTPASHFLESWGDTEYLDGTASIIQPLIAPLFQSRSDAELISALLDQAKTGQELTRATWSAAKQTSDFDSAWQEWLNEGIVPKTARPFVIPVVSSSFGGSLGPAASLTSSLEIVFRPDPTIWDGRHSNNGWLQELPKPLTTMTWENTLMVSPRLAEQLKLENGDMVELSAAGVKVEIPTYVHVGHPEGSVTVHFGYGRKVVGNVGTETGVNVYPMRRTDGMWSTGVDLRKLGPQVPLGLTQTHFSMEGRNLVRSATVAEFAKDPEMRTEGDEVAAKNLSMYPDDQHTFDGPQWGMSIDLNVCTGCHACVTACQAENNIPVVGKTQVVRGREMHWIRIDRYYRVMDGAAGHDATDYSESTKDVLDSNAIEAVFQPVACMHCEKAPCEPVCPVAATVHSHEGLNQMVYNRCVGTRYCSNNCPYKVRRFNFLNYTDNMVQFDTDDKRPLLRMLNNPNVTVRGRGVMEKCTYCVQRINDSRIEAKKAGRETKDGEIVTACQQACPTQAIVFGNIADKGSAVSIKKREPRNYSMLAEINTHNRTTYLAKLRNPHPEFEKA